MNKRFFPITLLATIIITSCNSGPSESDIKEKILIEFVCMETAKVNNLKVINTKDAETISGTKAYEYTVSGEVEWPKGCTDFGTRIAEGFVEKFENKKVYLADNDGKWK